MISCDLLLWLLSLVKSDCLWKIEKWSKIPAVWNTYKNLVNSAWWNKMVRVLFYYSRMKLNWSLLQALFKRKTNRCVVKNVFFFFNMDLLLLPEIGHENICIIFISESIFSVPCISKTKNTLSFRWSSFVNDFPLVQPCANYLQNGTPTEWIFVASMRLQISSLSKQSQIIRLLTLATFPGFVLQSPVKSLITRLNSPSFHHFLDWSAQRLSLMRL